LAGILLIIFGLVVLAVEGTSFISLGLESLIYKIISAPLWARGIVYIIFSIIVTALFQYRNIYPATGLLTFSGICYIIVGILVS
jgi:hypothetical protein